MNENLLLNDRQSQHSNSVTSLGTPYKNARDYVRG